MRKIREVLRLKHELGLENRQIAKCCRISHVTVGNYLARFAKAGLSWPLGLEWDDGRLSDALFGVKAERQPGRELPSLIEVHRELRRPGVTLTSRNPALSLLPRSPGSDSSASPDILADDPVRL